MAAWLLTTSPLPSPSDGQGSAVFDFSGTGPEVFGNLNAPRAITLSALIYCLRCLVGRDIPLNQVRTRVLCARSAGRPGAKLADGKKLGVLGALKESARCGEPVKGQDGGRSQPNSPTTD